MESDPSYSQFCEGNILNSTNTLSEELFQFPTCNSVDSESDDGDEEDFILDDGILPYH